VRLAELLQQEEEDLQRDCTFKPQINPHPSHHQRGEFLAEAQLRERKKRLQQLLAADNPAGDDAVVRSLRSAISDTSPSSVATSNAMHRSPASALQFSPALSRAASIVGAAVVGGGSSSAASHGRHEDPDLKGDFDANAAAAVKAVEKVNVCIRPNFVVLTLVGLQILVAPPAELPESDEDVQDDRPHSDPSYHDEQRHRRGGLRGSTAVAAVAAADAHSANRLHSRLQHENQVNQVQSSSRSVRSPNFFIPRPSVVVSSGNPAPVTPSLRHQLRQHSAPRPASAPVRSRGGIKEAGGENKDIKAGSVVRSRALPSRIAGATAVATAAARQAAEDLAVESDQPRKKNQVSSSVKHMPAALPQNTGIATKDLPSMLYKDAEFRTLRRQLLGVQQELIMEQSATP
jgi:hypothetical protein